MMDYRTLGGTGLTVSGLCFGTMTFGDRFGSISGVDQDGATALVRGSLDAGIDFFDTADVYSRGQAEEMLGRALRAVGVDRESVVIATKVRGTMSDAAAQGRGDFNRRGLSRKHIVEALDASLRRLGMDYVDLYQIHGLDEHTPLEETVEALDHVVRQGKALYVGCSNIATRHIMKARAHAERLGLAGFVSLQAYYSLVARDVEHELLPLCREEGLGFLAWSPLSGGLLSGKYRQHAGGGIARSDPVEADIEASGGDTTPAGRRSTFDFPPVHEAAADALGGLETVARAHDVSLATVALAWLRHQPGVTSIIIGARDDEQLRQNLAAAELELTPDELERLGAATKPKVLYPQWMIDRQRLGR
jgi:aryl-alcohol dehydrogenase-like predicted oxidoreductase